MSEEREALISGARARGKRYQRYSCAAWVAAFIAIFCSGGLTIASLIVSGQDTKKGNKVFYGAGAGVGVFAVAASLACYFSRQAKKLEEPKGPSVARPGTQG